MQFCLRALNNVLYVFLLMLALFLKYYVCKKPVFVVTPARDHKDGNFSYNPTTYWSFATCNLKKMLISGF